MSHALSAAVCALVVVASLRNEFLAAGVAAGLAFAIRPQNATFILVPILIAGLPALWKCVGGFLAGALPQLVVATVLYGSPITLLNIAPGNANRSFMAWRAFERVWPWQPLFSWYHGLATWTPLLAISIIGLPFLFRAHRGLAIAAVYSIAAQWVINATVDRFFWSGSSFGQRRFDNCTIFFLLGAAALFAHLPRWLAALIAAVTSLWTMALFFAASVIDLNRYYGPKELIDAALHAPIQIGFLVSVPTGFKLRVLVIFTAVTIAYALFAFLLRFRPGITAAIYCIVIAVFFAFCGANDSAKMSAWSDVIARNRAIEPYSGAVHDRLALLKVEEDYLRRCGRAADADETRQAIAKIERR